MSCSPFDLKDYFLRELSGPEHHQVEAHVKTCPACREELDRLYLTQTALFSLREEEIPQRIGFVSDKIFEPSPWRRWWSGFWGSASRLGFASAAMLSASILVYALRPAPPLNAGFPAPSSPAPIVQPASAADIQARIDSAVAKAMAETEARRSEQFEQLVSGLQSQQQHLIWATSEMEIERKRLNTMRTAALHYRMPPSPGGKEDK